MFWNKKDKELEGIIEEIKVDLSNNYKDNAVLGIKKLKEKLSEKEASGKMKEKELKAYRDILNSFEEDVKNFKRTY
ncbi:MAG: hypothetical protein K6E28_11275 [Eubacterium sp.]|nr:hypothetical protein [Eubacterium sp.]